MNYVEPIRDRRKIAQIKNLLRGRGDFRNLLLFVVGINSALRISDLLQLRIGDFFEKSGKIRDRFSIKELKRGKRQEIVINSSIKDTLIEFKEYYPQILVNPDNPVFLNPQTHQSIKRGQAWKFISNICREVGLSGNYGTHSLRKTWGYHARINGVDLALIMHKLNHNSIAYTKRYLGITDDELEEIVKKLNL
jgi:integrase